MPSHSILRRLAAFSLLLSLLKMTETGWSETVGGQIVAVDYTLPGGTYLRFINNMDSGVNGAVFNNNGGTVQADGNFFIGTLNWAVFNQNGGQLNVDG